MTTAAGRRWGDPPPPSDPWPVHADTPDFPVAAPTPRNGRRPIYGRVYELFTDDPRDGEHPYVGQVRTPKTIAARQREHRAEVARFPWKARLIDGPRGRRLLETVYSTGDPRHDQAILDQVEAFWIDRLRTTHNGPRPVRPRHGDPLPPRPRDDRPARRRPVRTRRHLPWRAVLFLALAVILSAVAWRLTAALALPWPWAPWAAAPVAGVPLAWRLTVGVLAKGRRLKVWR